MKLLISLVLSVALVSPILAANKAVTIKVEDTTKYIVDCDARYEEEIKRIHFMRDAALTMQAREQCRIANALFLLAR